MDESVSISINAWGVELKKRSLHCNFNYVIYLSTFWNKNTYIADISESRLNFQIADLYSPKSSPDRLQSLQPPARPREELEPVAEPVNMIWLLR